MADVSIQFHALPEELSQLFAGLCRDPTVHVVTASGIPMRFATCAEATEVFSKTTGARAVAFSLSEPNLEVPDLYQFRQLNPDALLLEIGEFSDIELGESWLSARTENDAAVKRWKQVSMAVKAATQTGATAVNPQTGASAPMRWHRFTIGAHRAYKHGTKMGLLGGNSLVILPK